MNDQSTVVNIYEQRVLHYNEAIAAVTKKRTGIAWARFAVVVITGIISYFCRFSELWLLLAVIACGIGAFLYIVSIDTDSKRELENLLRLLQINKDEIDVIHNRFHHRENGSLLEPEHHAYVQDLDMFGNSSLYQYLNRCNAEQAKQLLARNLSKASGTEAINLQQAAVKELQSKIEWRQQFQSLGIEEPITIATEQRIAQWLGDKELLFEQKFYRWLVIIFPVVTLASVWFYLTDVISASLFYAAVFAFFIFASSFSKKIHATYLKLSKVVDEVTTLFTQLDWLEQEKFESKKLAALQLSLQVENKTASKEILELKNILNRFDVRLNIFAFYILNTFLLWDLRQMLALNTWKRKNEFHVLSWVNAIIETEVTTSIATLTFNNPDWCFPKIVAEHFVLHGKNIGHPLIPAGQRVDNSFSLEGVGKVALITGSNMAGKSTFLRSLGVNIVLALMGAPVCADEFEVSNVKLMSSMRIADNLAENTSTFYAELKKLETIIQAVNRRENIFILLDEILRGTNSLDRHTGSKALIQQLIEQNAVAVIATHDVELAKLEESFTGAITNYHFDVQVANDELYFDYKLKDGVCKSLNASILMRKIGIHVK